MIIKNTSKNIIVSQNGRVADSFLKRLKGLMFTKEMLPQSALLFYPCSGIHTCFMNYPIDVLYLDTNNKVLAIDEAMKPWKLGRYVKGSAAVVELPCGRIRETHTEIGDSMKFIMEGGLE